MKKKWNFTENPALALREALRRNRAELGHKFARKKAARNGIATGSSALAQNVLLHTGVIKCKAALAYKQRFQIPGVWENTRGHALLDGSVVFAPRRKSSNDDHITVRTATCQPGS